jgi:quinol monooxygenase YgiN
MGVFRIGEFQAKPELTEDIREFLLSILTLIKSSAGCESVQLFQSQNDPSKFLMLEVWDRVESHQASVKNIPPEKLGEIQPILAISPSGSYFYLVSES